MNGTDPEKDSIEHRSETMIFWGNAPRRTRDDHRNERRTMVSPGPPRKRTIFRIPNARRPNPIAPTEPNRADRTQSRRPNPIAPTEPNLRSAGVAGSTRSVGPVRRPRPPTPPQQSSRSPPQTRKRDANSPKRSQFRAAIGENEPNLLSVHRGENPEKTRRNTLDTWLMRLCQGPRPIQKTKPISRKRTQSPRGPSA
jgi:hypothetical protein